MSKITVLVIKPERKPYIKEIENTLKSLQHEVGGYIQAVYPWEEPVALIVEEESKLKSSPFNRALRDEQGNFLRILFYPHDCHFHLPRRFRVLLQRICYRRRRRWGRAYNSNLQLHILFQDGYSIHNSTGHHHSGHDSRCRLRGLSCHNLHRCCSGRHSNPDREEDLTSLRCLQAGVLSRNCNRLQCYLQDSSRIHKSRPQQL